MADEKSASIKWYRNINQMHFIDKHLHTGIMPLKYSPTL